MKLIIVIFLSTLMGCSTVKLKPVKVFGETNYSKKETESLRTSFNIEYQVHLYEPDHKKWLLYIGGKVSPDYDHFGKEIRVNTFTTIGIDF